MSRPQESGGSLRDEYLSIERQKGQDWTHPGLVPKPFPDGLQYLFQVAQWQDDEGRQHFGLGGWFGELTAARSSNGFGANPITFTEIKAWAELTGRRPSPLEIVALRRLDALFLSVMGRKSDG